MPHKEIFKRFTESQVNRSIKRKVGDKTTGKRGGDPKIIFELDGKIIDFIRIPNPHRQKTFWPKQSKRIADDLNLSASEYNRLIDCVMKGNEFRDLARKRFFTS